MFHFGTIPASAQQLPPSPSFFPSTARGHRGRSAGSMGTPSGKGALWWDRDSDRMGRPIRADVRAAAHEIWNHACARVRAALGDDCDAAEMMEVSVERVSRYLDSQGSGVFSHSAPALLTIALRRQIQKHQIKRERIEFLGGASDLEQRVCAPNGFGGVNQQMDLKKIMRRLSGRSYRILLRRRDGIDWKSISEELGISRQTAQNSFWREIRQAQLDLLKIDGEKEISPIKHSLDGGKGKAMKKSPHSASRSARRGHRTGTD